MATCEVCGAEVGTLEVLGVQLADGLHYACSADHIAVLKTNALARPTKERKERAEVLEEAPRPEAKRRGRPPKVRPAATEEAPPLATSELKEPQE